VSIDSVGRVLADAGFLAVGVEVGDDVEKVRHVGHTHLDFLARQVPLNGAVCVGCVLDHVM
jgi:hypothetical protein